MSEITEPCPDCDGDGWYTPAFSSRVRVNCETCNPEWRQGGATVTPLEACKLRTARGAIDRFRDEARDEALAYRYWSAELCDPDASPEVRDIAFSRMNRAQCAAACAWSYLAELLEMVGEREA